ncbi:uncharacterized protein LOC141613374 [Silene latifolia]|uniref:uncharacterized protein LOC141613374 n=1 Tax=Silene latifolia TaxID=37657 RepID=UPI003D76D9FE
MEEDSGTRGGKLKDVSDGCVGSLSSSFKNKVSITESSSTYVGDGNDCIPFGKRALYYYHPVDSEVVQEMYGLPTHGDLVRLVESTRKKDEDIISPNLRFTYGVEPYSHDSDPRIGSIAIQKEQALDMARSSDRAASGMMMRRRLPEGSYLPTPWRKPDLKPAAPVPNQEEMWRKRYEKWEEEEDELLHALDLRMATRGLACFNLKFKTDYMVEQVLGSQKMDLGKGCYFHCNFIARSKKALQQRLFFAEVENAVRVTLCCTLDHDGVRGCRFCGNEFVHPSEEGLLTVGGN